MAGNMISKVSWKREVYSWTEILKLLEGHTTTMKSRRANSHSISLARCIAEVRGPLMLMPVISVQNFFDLIDAKASENLAAKKLAQAG